METNKERRRLGLLLNIPFSGIAGFMAGCLLLVACTNSETPIINEEDKQKEEEVTVYFESSGDSSPNTYALSATDENQVRSIDVLAFGNDGGTEKYLYRREVEAGTIVEESDSRRRFTVTLKNDGKICDYAIIVNASAEVRAFFPDPDNSHAGEEKETLFQALLSEQTGLWNTTNTSADYRAIPMYGESGFRLISQLKNSTITVVRSLARIDISSSVALAHFSLKEVYVYNRNTRGRIAGRQDYLDKTRMVYTSPSLPANVGRYHPTGNYGTSNTGYSVPNGERSLVRTIYLYEADAPSVSDLLNATHLVVGGTYQGGAMTYYRIDLVDIATEDSEGTDTSDPDWWDGKPPSSGTGDGGAVGTGNPYRPIIRNYHYEIHITGASDVGQTSKDLASQTLNSRLLYDYISWNDLSEEVKVGSTTYSVKVDKTIVSVPGTVTATVTGAPSWDIEKSDTYDWFTVTRSGATLNVSLTGTPEANLTGYFKIVLKNSSNEAVLQKTIRVEYEK